MTCEDWVDIRNSDDDVPNFEAMITAAVANALPNLTAALRTQITNDIRNGAASSGGGGGDAIPQGIHVWIERFTKLKPLAFRSAATPAEAEDWITHMEKLFQVLGCPDNFKTRLLCVKLEGDALRRWKLIGTQNSGVQYMDEVYFDWRVLMELMLEYDPEGKIDISSGGLKKVEVLRNVNTDYTNVAQVAAAARNIELLHESGNSNKRDRDGNRIQNRGQGQQERTSSAGQREVKDCPQGKQKQEYAADFARQPPTTGGVYAMTCNHFNPMKSICLLIDEYVNCPLCFDDRIHPANLLPIHMLDFNVISWHGLVRLSASTIDCYARTVIFGVKGAVTGDVGEWLYRPVFRLGWTGLYMLRRRRGACACVKSEQEKFYGAWGYYRRFIEGFPISFTSYPDEGKGGSLCGGLMSVRRVLRIETKDWCCSDIDSSITVRWIQIYSDASKNSYVVADALSRKSGMIACFDSIILHDLERLDVELCVRGSGGYWASMRIESNLMLQIKEAQKGRRHFARDGMKQDVATFVSKCMTCQQVKIEHQRASGLLQPLEIPMWKWDEISMDFVTGLPTTQKRHDAIWVVVDRLTKSAHFLPIRKNYGISKLAEIFRQEIVRLHGTPTSIVSDRDPKFTSRFWKGLQKAWGTRLKFSTAFHPQTDGQSERTIQTLEDMLRACALEWTGSWDEYLCLVEFAYNNSWHASIKAAPFELLYGRKCRAPICWDEVGERLIEGPELIEITNEKVAVAKEKLKEARSRQKSYADKHRRDLEFQVGDRVFLKVSPFRGVKRFGIKGKLSPRFIGPFEILERIGEVSYRLALPPQLSHVHDVFHVSLLRGYHYHPLHVASYPFDQIQPDMSLSEEPESILDRQERVMRNKVIPFVKILWKNHPEREATWETEESMRASYPHFFV
ncbi:putative nucleotidyltransferase, ribonuclease H [Tanacetum coccineum]